MKAGRKSNPATEVVDDDFSPDAAMSKSTSLTELAARSHEISIRFGDGLPYDRNRCIGLTRTSLNLGAASMLEAGRQLIQIKENEPHGEFLDIVQGQLGINPRTAQRMMGAAAKFLSLRLGAKSDSVSLLGSAKLYDLMAEDDSAIEALAAGGTLAGHTLDEMACMTHKELQAALTEERKKAAAKDKVIKAKSEKLDKLEEEMAMREHAPMEEAEALQIEDLRDRTLQAEHELLRLLATVDAVLRQPATTAAELDARHSLDYLVQRIVDGCMERGITVDLAERVSPIWAAPIEAAAKADHKRGKSGKPVNR